MKTRSIRSYFKKRWPEHKIAKTCLLGALFGLTTIQNIVLSAAVASQTASPLLCQEIVASQKNLSEILVDKSIRDQVEEMVSMLDKKLASGRKFVNTDRSLFLEVGRQLGDSIHLLSHAEIADRMIEVFARDLSAAGKLPGFGAHDSVKSLNDLVHDLAKEANSSQSSFSQENLSHSSSHANSQSSGLDMSGQMWANWLRNSLQMSPASALVLGLHESNEQTILVNPHRVLNEIEAAVLQREIIQRLHGPDRPLMLRALGVSDVQNIEVFERNLHALWLSVQPQGKIAESDLPAQRLNFEFSSEQLQIVQPEVGNTENFAQMEKNKKHHVFEVTSTVLNKQMQEAGKKVQNWPIDRLRKAYELLLGDLRKSRTNENDNLETIKTIPMLLSMMSDEILQAYRNAVYQYPEDLRLRVIKEMRVKFFAQPGRPEGLAVNPLGADLFEILSTRLHKLGILRAHRDKFGFLQISKIPDDVRVTLRLEIGTKDSDLATLELATYAEEIVRRFYQDRQGFLASMGISYPNLSTTGTPAILGPMGRLRTLFGQ